MRRAAFSLTVIAFGAASSVTVEVVTTVVVDAGIASAAAGARPSARPLCGSLRWLRTGTTVWFASGRRLERARRHRGAAARDERRRRRRTTHAWDDDDDDDWHADVPRERLEQLQLGDASNGHAAPGVHDKAAVVVKVFPSRRRAHAQAEQALIKSSSPHCKHGTAAAPRK